MVNKANVDQLISWVKADVAHFKMQAWTSYLDRPEAQPVRYEPCNTAFCLGGLIWWHQEINNGTVKSEIDLEEPSDEAFIRRGRTFLDLDYDTARDLFFMNFDGFGMWWSTRERFDEMSDAFRERATVQVLEHLRDTGEVDWKKAIEDTAAALGEPWEGDNSSDTID